MVDFEKIDRAFYTLRFGDTEYLENVDNNKKILELWDKIKCNSEILNWAIQTKRNKWDDGDIINGVTISDAILIDYENIDINIYNKLIKVIYTNKDIARIRLQGNRMASRASDSFLTLSLYNHDLKLTKDQKEFAVSEAMRKDIRDHFYGAFDIRYRILRNPNWTLEEKQNLVMMFYHDSEYDDILDEWEWDVVNDRDNYQGRPFPPFDKYELLNDWTYEMLLKLHKNKKITDRIWEEMEFCKQMRKLRPQQWELQLTSSNNKKQLFIKALNKIE